jgi:hypothetical protein|tara:strand:- start:1859 stop:2905 length:1047 start_codon:yes stop_codon:yes gene_type:complete
MNLNKVGINSSYVKGFIDPDLAEEWKKFQKRYPYLFWVRAMNIKDSKKWRKFLKGKEPNIESKPILPKRIDEFVKIAIARRNIYFHIARSFSEPTKDFVENLLIGDFDSTLKTLTATFVSESRTLEGIQLLKKYLRHIKGKQNTLILERLRDEHLTIFYDSFFPWLSCYESVYRGEKQIIGELTGIVNKSYEKAGCYLTGDYGNDPADDVKIELQFMYLLCERELESWRKGDKKTAISYLEMQYNHLHKHMIEWIPYLCDDLLNPEFRKGVSEKFHRTTEVREEDIKEFDFYVSIGAITKNIIECDYNQVQAMLEMGKKMDGNEVLLYLKDERRLGLDEEGFSIRISR